MKVDCAQQKYLHESSPTLLKKRLWHRCFPVNFVKFLRTPFYIKHLWSLLPKLRNISNFKQKKQNETKERVKGRKAT